MAYAAAYTTLPTPQGAREEESLVFRLAARRLRDAADRKARNAALGINHEVWSHMFRDLNAAREPAAADPQAGLPDTGALVARLQYAGPAQGSAAPTAHRYQRTGR